MPRPKKGERTPGSGRPKGKTNGDTAKLREIILGALDDAGGRKYLANQAVENPAAFLSLIGKVVPREVSAEIGGSLGVTIIERVIIDAAANTDGAGI